MKTTENKTKRIEVRLTEKELELFTLASKSIGLTPSKSVRMFIDATINQLKIKIKKGEIVLEDIKTILDD